MWSPPPPPTAVLWEAHCELKAQTSKENSYAPGCFTPSFTVRKYSTFISGEKCLPWIPGMEMCLCGTLMPGELPKGIAAAVPQEKHLQEIFYVEGKKKKNSSWHSPQREIPVTFFWQASNKYSHRSILLIFPWQARAIFFTLAKNMENKLQAYFLSWFRCKISLLSEAKGKESIKYSKTVIREKKVHLKGKTKDRSSGILPA